MFQEENEQKIKELKETRMDLEAQFNKFKYSDADEAAKIDNDLFEMTQKTKENNKLANEYRTKLERQNSRQVRLYHDSNRNVAIKVLTIGVEVAHNVVHICKQIPVIQAEHAKWSYDDQDNLPKSYRTYHDDLP